MLGAVGCAEASRYIVNHPGLPGCVAHPDELTYVSLGEGAELLAERASLVAEGGLPASFAVASYRASLLPLLGDAAEASLQGATAELARLPVVFTPEDDMVRRLMTEHQKRDKGLGGPAAGPDAADVAEQA